MFEHTLHPFAQQENELCFAIRLELAEDGELPLAEILFRAVEMYVQASKAPVASSA